MQSQFKNILSVKLSYICSTNQYSINCMGAFSTSWSSWWICFL